MWKRKDQLRRGLPLFLLSAACLGMGPCGPVAGGALSEAESDALIDDWSFANQVPRCAVELRPSHVEVEALGACPSISLGRAHGPRGAQARRVSARLLVRS